MITNGIVSVTDIGSTTNTSNSYCKKNSENSNYKKSSRFSFKTIFKPNQAILTDETIINDNSFLLIFINFKLKFNTKKSIEYPILKQIEYSKVKRKPSINRKRRFYANWLPQNPRDLLRLLDFNFLILI